MQDGVRNPSLRYLAFEGLKRGILTGVLRPGTTLAENRVAHELGLSRTPVREALGMLEVLGLVLRKPSRGFVVRGFSRRDVQHLFRVRRLLEESGIADACANVEDADVDRLCGLLEKLEASEPYSIEFRGLHKDFHRAVQLAAGNPFLIRLVDPLLDLAELAWEVTAPGADRHERGRRGHRGILEAIRSRDPARAVAAMHVHLVEAEADMMEAFDAMDSRLRRPTGLAAIMEGVRTAETRDDHFGNGRVRRHG